MKVLITSGATYEPIDQVRSITNFSTGRTGKEIADYLSKKGHQVFYVYSQKGPLPNSITKGYPFLTSDDLESITKKLLKSKNLDVVIQMAAVSDYFVEKVLIGNKPYSPNKLQKISSEKEVILKLKTRPKIINNLKMFSKNKKLKVIGFKLTNSPFKNERLKQIFKLSLNPKIDFVVHNDFSEIDKKNHIAHIYKKNEVIAKSNTKRGLAKNLNKILKELL